MQYEVTVNKTQFVNIQIAIDTSLELSKGMFYGILAEVFQTTLLNKTAFDLGVIESYCVELRQELMNLQGLSRKQLGELECHLTAPLNNLQDLIENTHKITNESITFILTEEESRLLNKALEVYSRLGLGQIDNAIDLVYCDSLLTSNNYPASEKIRIYCDSLKRLITGHPSNGSYGICSEDISDDFRVSYDIQQVLRNKMAWDKNPSGGIQVSYQQPIQWSKQPLPKVMSVEGVNGK